MKKNNAGFTLIEVLIALAILAIALTAIIKSTAENIKNTAYLQNKTIASWVGMEAINEIRAGILAAPTTEAIEQETEMLGKTWAWQAETEPTPNPRIKKIIVTVKAANGNANLIRLESYIYAAT